MRCAQALPLPVPSQALLALGRRASDHTHARPWLVRPRRALSRRRGGRARKPDKAVRDGGGRRRRDARIQAPARAARIAGAQQRGVAHVTRQVAHQQAGRLLLPVPGPGHLRARVPRGQSAAGRPRLAGGGQPAAPAALSCYKVCPQLALGAPCLRVRTQAPALRRAICGHRRRPYCCGEKRGPVPRRATKQQQVVGSVPQPPEVLVRLKREGTLHLGPHLEGTRHARSLVLDGLQGPRRLPGVLEADTGSAGGSTGHLVAHLRQPPSVLCLRQPDRLCSPIVV
jgi:hypothetical protein